jgi:hypothetical protein
MQIGWHNALVWYTCCIKLWRCTNRHPLFLK